MMVALHFSGDDYYRDTMARPRHAILRIPAGVGMESI
jgi:hypothetical protein